MTLTLGNLASQVQLCCICLSNDNPAFLSGVNVHLAKNTSTTSYGGPWWTNIHNKYVHQEKTRATTKPFCSLMSGSRSNMTTPHSINPSGSESPACSPLAWRVRALQGFGPSGPHLEIVSNSARKSPKTFQRGTWPRKNILWIWVPRPTPTSLGGTSRFLQLLVLSIFSFQPGFPVKWWDIVLM